MTTLVPTPTDGGWRSVAACVAVCLAAYAIRVVAIFMLPSLHFPDETFQATEQAHRLVYGSGLVPWEFQYGTRSWIVPGFVAGIMEFARIFGDGPSYYLPAIGITLAGLSIGAVACAFLWGRRAFGLWGGIVAATVPAVWTDCVYFAPRAFSEVVAAHLLVIAIYLIEPGYRVVAWRRLALGGALLGLVGVLRIQLLPAIAIIALWFAVRAFRQERSTLVPVALGAVAAAALAGSLDAFTWGYPFAAAWRNFEFNFLYGGADYFGTAPWNFYIRGWWHYWKAAALVLGPLMAVGAIRFPLLLLVIGAILVSHSLVGHKELRFVYPAIFLATILAGAGAAQSIAWLSNAFRTQGDRPRWIIPTSGVVAIASISILSLGVARSERYRDFFYQRSGMVLASAYVSQLPNVCGIATFQIPWWETGGYAHFHLPVGLYWPSTQAEFERASAGFNVVIYTEQPASSSAKTFRPLRCFDRTCVARRDGGCTPAVVDKVLMPAPEFDRFRMSLPDAR